MEDKRFAVMRMKKVIIILSVLFIFVICIIAAGFVFQCNYVNVSFAADVDIINNDEIISVNKEDIDILKNIFRGFTEKGKAEGDFDGIKLIFKGSNNKYLTMTLERRGGSVIMVGNDKYINIKEDGISKLRGILEQYNLELPSDL